MFLEIFITIIILACLLYLLGAVTLVLFYDARLRKLYRLRQQIELQIESLPRSMAVKHAKIFRLEQEYFLATNRIEVRRNFIISRMLNIQPKKRLSGLDWQANV